MPQTGIGLEFERLLSPIFIRGETYGTRCGTLVERNEEGTVVVLERRYGPQGVSTGRSAWNSERGEAFVGDAVA